MDHCHVTIFAALSIMFLPFISRPATGWKLHLDSLGQVSVWCGSRLLVKKTQLRFFVGEYAWLM